MWEKFIAFLFGGILLVLFYHPFSAFILHHFLAMSPTALRFWYVPLAVIPGLMLLGLAWLLGFGRQGSSVWGNLGALTATCAIVFFTLGAPYNCWHQFCF